MKIDFGGRSVVVTGGAGALGSATVAALLDAGAVCHVPARSKPDMKRLNWPADRVHVVEGVELSDPVSVERFYAGVGRLWASIHLAGGFTMSPIMQTTLRDWREMIDDNATSCFLCCREAVKWMRMTGEGGRMVNVASRVAMAPAGEMVAYTAAKAAVVGITQSLGEELAAEQIWVNAVVPSVMDTPANRASMPAENHRRWPKVAEVAATILFLASPQNAVTRGAMVSVYGQS